MAKASVVYWSSSFSVLTDDIQVAFNTSVVDRPSNEKDLTQKWGLQSVLTLCWTTPSEGKPPVHLSHQKRSAYYCRHLRGNKTIDRFITRLNLEIKLWPVKGNHSVRIPLSQSECDAVSIWLRSSEIEVIVWAKYCPPVDTTQLLLTPLTVSCVPSYIKAMTSSKGKPGQSSLQDCIMDQLWEPLSRHIMKEN